MSDLRIKTKFYLIATINIRNFHIIDQLVYASKVKKTNMFDWTQERTLAITDNAIYNIHKHQIKRCIYIKDIGGMTKTVFPSKCTTEFTIHVPSTYDYRFVSEK